MPTYEYRCKECGHNFDAVQSFSDDALTQCPACGGPLRKVFGSVGISFKGSGFYKTDSRTSSGSSSSSKTSVEAGKSSDTSTSGGSTSTTSSEGSSSTKSDAGSSSSTNSSTSSSSGDKAKATS